MRTRNAGAPKAPKKAPTTRKSAAKAAASAATPVEESTPELVTPTSAPEPVSTATIEPVSEPAIEHEKASAEDAVADTPTKVASTPKKRVVKTRKVIKKVLRPKTPASAKAGSAAADKVPEAEDAKDDQSQKDDDMTDAKDAKDDQGQKDDGMTDAKDAKDDQGLNEDDMTDAKDAKDDQGLNEDDMTDTKDAKDDQGQKDDNMTDAKDEQSLKVEEEILKVTESEEQEELGTQREGDLQEAQDKDKEKDKMDLDDLSTTDATITEKTESLAEDIAKSAEQPSVSVEGEEVVECEEPIKEETVAAELLESEKEPQDRLDNVDDDQKLDSIEEDKQNLGNINDGQTEKAEEASQLKEDDVPVSDGIEDYGEEEGFVEPGEEDLREDDEPETTDEGKALNEENKEMAAAAKERKIKREHEIFVGGLDREVVEEDIKKAFEKVGEVLEVRLLKHPSTNKSRGFAFVRFASRDQANKALSEMKNPVICGKQCGTAPNDENDTLFVGNICNTWTKEAISLKLKDYNVEGVESITLVQDPRHEGLSRGFCFVQFACHADAMSAYKKLQKPDVIFGHAERSVKVAIAEPLQEPDPEVMAKVKSVFIDGLPPYWDEDSVRKHFKSYGEIERVTLARNMSTAKRKDFGFVDYKTHEAAIACIEDVNKKELGDGNSKTKVRARLSNPLPKMQAVKGAMRGGFRVGHPSGRSLGRPAPPVNRHNYQYNRVPRAPFNNPVGPYVQRVPHRGGHGAPRASGLGRPNFGGPRHGLIERGPARPMPPRREPFPIDDGGFSRPFMGRHYDNPYMYDDRHGLKRPFYATEQDPAYVEQSRVRPRFDYTGTGRGTHFGDTFGAGGSSTYPSGYYGADYGARPVRPPSSFNARGRPYGGGPSGRGGGSGYYY